MQNGERVKQPWRCADCGEWWSGVGKAPCKHKHWTLAVTEETEPS